MAKQIYEFFPKYKEKEYAEKVLTYAIPKYPDLALKYLDNGYEGIDPKPKYLEKLINQAKEFVAFKSEETLNELVRKKVSNKDFPIDKKLWEEKITNIYWLMRQITISKESFGLIFFSNSFQEAIKKKSWEITWISVFSLVHAVHRNIELQNGKKDEQTIKTVISKILEKLDKIKWYELIWPNTQIILFTHEWKEFNNEKIIDNMLVHAWVSKDKILSVKWVKMVSKEEISQYIKAWHKRYWWEIDKKYLDDLTKDNKDNKYNIEKIMTQYAIAHSKWSTTLIFAWHWTPEFWAFSQNLPSNLKNSLEQSESTINYTELWDALIYSDNIENINLLWFTCSAYDFIQNLFAYLESKWVIKKPRISISEANNRKNWFSNLDDKSKTNDYLMDAMIENTKQGSPMTVATLLSAEWDIYIKEDPALLVWNDVLYWSGVTSKDNSHQSVNESEKPWVSQNTKNKMCTPAKPSNKRAKYFIELSSNEENSDKNVTT